MPDLRVPRRSVLHRLSSGLVLGVAILILGSSTAYALDPARGLAQYVDTHFAARDGLPHGLANSLAQTPDGYLWIGTEEGLARFDGDSFTTFARRTVGGPPTNTFHALAVDPSGTLWAGTRDHGLVVRSDGAFQAVGDPTAGMQVRALAFAHDGDLWVGTRDRGVVRVRARTVVGRLDVADGLPSDQVGALFVDRDGALWIGTFRGVAQLRDGRLVAGPAALNGIDVRSIVQDRTGDLWFGTAKGLAQLHAGVLGFVAAGELPLAEVQCLLVDRDGALWLGLQSGIARRSPGGQIELLALRSAVVLTLFEDRQGDLWIGTEGGLDRLRDGDVVPVGASEGVTNEISWGIREDLTGAMWIGASDGLYRIPPGGGAATNVAPGHGTIYAILVDAGGDVWAGARDGSLGRWHDGRFTWQWRGGWEKVNSIIEALGTYWLGTDHGLFRLVNDRWEEVDPAPIVTALLPDGHGGLWLGTEAHGLQRWQAGARAAVPAGGPPATSSVTTFTVDPDGTLWLGTEGDGLWRLRDGGWFQLTSKDGLFDDVIWRILDDGLGNLWLSSNRGIWRMARAQLEARAAGGGRIDSVAYGEVDGMRNRECNGGIFPAGWRARDGRLWFPTGAGVAVIDPAHLHPASPPAATLESVRADSRDQGTQATLVVAPGTSRLEVRYTAPELRAPERVRFRYRLEGFDEAWNDAGAQRVAQYTNLSPGHYRFVVQATLDGGAWGREGGLDLTLRPRFRQTIWFAMLVIGAALVATLAAPVLRVRQLRARERELDARVKAAVSELKVLSGLLPICAWCKKVRDDGGYWSKIEAYLSARTDAQFTHGICPECVEQVDAENEVDATRTSGPIGASGSR